MAKLEIKINNNKMKRGLLLILFSCAIGVLSAFASEKVKIGELYYNLDASNKTAEVTYQKYLSDNNYSGLTSVTIPSTVTYNSVTYSVTSIRDAFSNCKGLRRVTIPNSITNIGEFAFYGCCGLTSMTIPSSVTSIGYAAFDGCKGLTSITIPNNVTSIGNSAFYACENLTSITIGNSVIRIGEDAFGFCKGLTRVTIPNSVTSIGKGAFWDCKGLTSITIGNSVTSVEERAFLGCENLTSVTIPTSVTSIGENVFCRCKSLRVINVVTDNPNYCSVDGVLFNKNLTALVRYPARKQGVYSIPNSVASIEPGAFGYCKGLMSVTIPNNVTSIGKDAFYACENITSITIGNSVTSIGSFAFSDCASLTSVSIGNSVTSIGYKAFRDCDRLREVKYPKGLDLSRAEISSSATLIAYDRINTPQQKYYPSQPPLLTLQEGTLVFIDATHNDAINATEQCTIQFKIQNNGKGAANNCEAKVKLSGTTSGISVQTVKLPTIAVGQTYEVVIPVTTNINTQDGKVTFSIEVFEPNGWGIAPFDLSVNTKAFDAPLLQVVDYNITSSSGKIRKMEPFTLSFNVQNVKYGDAENVKVKVNLPSNVYIMDGQAELSFSRIKSGEAKTVQIVLAANNNYPNANIPITIDIKEKYGRFAENRSLDIALNQTTSTVIDIAGTREEQKRGEIKLATMSSDIDRNIPKSQIQNNNTIALVIANERYNNMPNVPYALNDGNIFKEYCLKTLGIPEENILYQSNATLNGIRQKLDLLQKKAQARSNAKRETNIIVYYTGHGVPDNNSRSAYLMPTDGYEENISTGYKLDDLYQQLGQLPAKTITVFLDACFSGVNRNDEALAQHKGARLVAKSGMPTGNMVVFAASQGNQTAFVNEKEQHGLFTYYILKKLQDSKGDVSLNELANYLTSEVNLKSLDIHEKEQIPSIIASPQVQNEWQNWKLK